MADPGFPIGGCGPHRRRCGLLRQLHFENFVCQNERIGTLRGVHAGCAPLDLPMGMTLPSNLACLACIFVPRAPVFHSHPRFHNSSAVAFSITISMCRVPNVTGTFSLYALSF